jgi:hypothetical protein
MSYFIISHGSITKIRAGTHTALSVLFLSPPTAWKISTCTAGHLPFGLISVENMSVVENAAAKDQNPRPVDAYVLTPANPNAGLNQTAAKAIIPTCCKARSF